MVIKKYKIHEAVYVRRGVSRESPYPLPFLESFLAIALITLVSTVIVIDLI